MEKVSALWPDAGGRPREVGDSRASACDRKFKGLISASSCSSAVNDCFSLEGDVIGEGPVLLGGVDGRLMTVVGEDGDEGRRKGEVRGELNDRGEGL